MGQRTLKIEPPVWKVTYDLEPNYWWFKDVVDNGDIIYLRSPVAREGLLKPGGKISIIVRELDMAHRAGYTRVGDFLIPPH